MECNDDSEGAGSVLGSHLKCDPVFMDEHIHREGAVLSQCLHVVPEPTSARQSVTAKHPKEAANTGSNSGL